jgi:ureidoacrylate peracid hydrolase
MHKIRIPQNLVDRVVARMGDRHSCKSLVPSATALLVVDMQNYFVMDGQQGECPMAREIVPNINRLAVTLRDAGGLVVWIKMLASEESRASWSVFHERLLPENRDRRMQALSEQGKGFALWSELDLAPQDEIVTKTRYSAFTPGASNLQALLDERGIDTVLVAGVATNTCCESTGRDAMALNFRTLMVADGCAAKSDDAHNATLCSFYNSFGDVQTTDEIVGLLKDATRTPIKSVIV